MEVLLEFFSKVNFVKVRDGILKSTINIGGDGTIGVRFPSNISDITLDSICIKRGGNIHSVLYPPRKKFHHRIPLWYSQNMPKICKKNIMFKKIIKLNFIR